MQLQIYANKNPRENSLIIHPNSNILNIYKSSSKNEETCLLKNKLGGGKLETK